jgi:hypothetical protein
LKTNHLATLHLRQDWGKTVGHIDERFLSYCGGTNGMSAVQFHFLKTKLCLDQGDQILLIFAQS